MTPKSSDNPSRELSLDSLNVHNSALIRPLEELLFRCPLSGRLLYSPLALAAVLDADRDVAPRGSCGQHASSF